MTDGLVQMYMRVRCLGLYCGCLDLYSGCLDLYSGFLDLYSGCLGLYSAWILAYMASIFASSKSPRAAGHAIGCASRWEYVCRQFQQTLCWPIMFQNVFFVSQHMTPYDQVLYLYICLCMHHINTEVSQGSCIR